MLSTVCVHLKFFFWVISRAGLFPMKGDLWFDQQLCLSSQLFRGCGWYCPALRVKFTPLFTVEVWSLWMKRKIDADRFLSFEGKRPKVVPQCCQTSWYWSLVTMLFRKYQSSSRWFSDPCGCGLPLCTLSPTSSQRCCARPTTTTLFQPSETQIVLFAYFSFRLTRAPVLLSSFVMNHHNYCLYHSVSKDPPLPNSCYIPESLLFVF